MLDRQVLHRLLATADRGQHALTQKVADGLRATRLGLGPVPRGARLKIQVGAHHQAQDQYRDRDADACAPGTHALRCAPLGLGLLTGTLFADAGVPARLDLAQAIRQQRDIAEPVVGIPIGRQTDVLAQHFVVDFALPARRQRPPQIAGHQLKQHHTERIDVGLYGERLAGDDFRRVVKRCTTAGGGLIDQGGEAHSGDVQRLQPGRIEQSAAAEITQADTDPAHALRDDQHVGGLEILVQHTQRMHLGERLGNLDDDVEAHGQRHRLDPALCLQPLLETAADAVFRLDEPGRLIEIPVDDFDAASGVADALLEQAEDRDLALEARQRARVIRELVDTHRPCLGMLGPPGIAGPAEAAKPAPAAAPRDGAVPLRRDAPPHESRRRLYGPQLRCCIRGFE